jgi:hypothetical protein
MGNFESETRDDNTDNNPGTNIKGKAKIESKKENSISFLVVNKANQPREFMVRGRWIRWEPSGNDRDRNIMIQEELNSADFTEVSNLFDIRRA